MSDEIKFEVGKYIESYSVYENGPEEQNSVWLRLDEDQALKLANTLKRLLTNWGESKMSDDKSKKGDPRIDEKLDELNEVGDVTDYHLVEYGPQDDPTTVLKVEHEIKLERL